MLCFKLRHFLVFFCLNLSFPAHALHVMIDPGHGGNDSGAFYKGIKESTLVLQVADKLIELLNANPDFTVSSTRTKDQFISLKDRVHLAEMKNVDLFVSLHANSASDSRARGMEFYFQNNLPPDEETLYLASLENNMSLNRKEISDIVGTDDVSAKGDVSAIVEDLKRQKRMSESLNLSKALFQIWHNHPAVPKNTIKQAPFYVVSKTSMPSVLIEVGFLTNPKESQLLASSSYRTEIAQNIYKALLEYKENLDNP